MIDDTEKHHRKSIRLKYYNYLETGGYFVTICALNRKSIFGDIKKDQMVLTLRGRIATDCWEEIPKHFCNVSLDEFVIMPNHLHGIIMINENGRGKACLAPTNRQFGRPIGNSLFSIIGSFKSAVTKRINKTFHTLGISVWQRNYYEHIVRNEKELNKIREYIINNSLKWNEDEENPENIKQRK